MGTAMAMIETDDGGLTEGKSIFMSFLLYELFRISPLDLWKWYFAAFFSQQT